ncbi:MAG TPA: GFA family protein [Luteibacter sp.]|nr:GFA family protein [Luteibacter sp.]HVI55310.1 GFA family protein [Luteibacter sp.]
MLPEITQAQGACHCGAVRFTVKLSDGLRTARRCNCSYCRMRGAVVVSAELDGITIEQGEDVLTLYQFNTGSAKHYFCSTCGIYTFHRRRSNNAQYGVNVACLEGISPFDFTDVPVLDGANHPADGGPRAGEQVGVLRFVASTAR